MGAAQLRRFSVVKQGAHQLCRVQRSINFFYCTVGAISITPAISKVVQKNATKLSRVQHSSEIASRVHKCSEMLSIGCSIAQQVQRRPQDAQQLRWVQRLFRFTLMVIKKPGCGQQKSGLGFTYGTTLLICRKHDHVLSKHSDPFRPLDLKGIDRPFELRGESRLIRSIMPNWRLGKFFPPF